MASLSRVETEDTGEQAPTQVEGTTIDSIGYSDIMLLGLTGQGKTTTAEKLLIANPMRIDYEANYTKESDKVPRVDSSNQQMIIQDLSMWFLPDDLYALERISTRMKNLAFYRVLDNPHKLVNDSHDSAMHVSDKTAGCELFSNETTKVRVLDVPGFLGAINGADQDSHNITLSAKEAHLGTIRNILQIQAAMSMKFKRILYFLPCRDTLQISNAALQQELQLMSYYFGRSIFESLVLVATLGPTTYRMVLETFPVEIPEIELERSRETIQEALAPFLPMDTPKPPIIFISLREICESILAKVQQTEVTNKDGIQLQLSSTVCARCSMTIGERKGMKVACISGRKWSEAILYKDSLCHPIFVPKYSKLQKIAGGISYTVKTIAKREAWRWPDFSVEKCRNCEGQPGTRGCLRVGSVYDVDGESIYVDHTSEVDEYHKQLIQDDPAGEKSHATNTTHQPQSSSSEKEETSESDDDGALGFLSDASIHRHSVHKKQENIGIKQGHLSSSTTGRSWYSVDERNSEESNCEEKVEVEIHEAVKRDNAPDIEQLSHDSQKN